ncbi:MAG TPA: FtsX-like permease family protein, partial [Bryobacteraceae bacterium]
TIRLNTVPTAIVGVMPPGLRFPLESDLWVPLTDQRQDRTIRNLTVFGHLPAGSGIAAARAEMSAIAGRLAGQYPEDKGIAALVQDFNGMALRKKFRSIFLLLLAAAGFVLVIACANVANLMLGRAVDRAREISIRTALGAGRWRIVRQLLVESVLLSSAGGVIGWLLAIWGARAFDLAVIPTGKPAWIDFSLDYRVLFYLSAVSIGTGILFGLAPALRLSRLDVGTALKEGARGIGAGPRGRYLSGVLVVAEVSLAVVLLVGAGLMLRGFLHVIATPIGVNTANVLTMKLDLPKGRYPRPDDQRGFYQGLEARLETLPGVEVAAVMSDMPGDGALHFEYDIDGVRSRVSGLLIGPDYFRVMQAPVVAGRAFTVADGPSVAIVNQAFVRRYWPGQSPLGKTVGRLTVVGVAPDIAQNNSDLLARDPLIYLPYRDQPRSAMFVAARTRVPPATVGPSFRRAVQAEDADLPVRELITLDEHVAVLYRLLWVFGGLFLIFAAIALELASVGLYAVISHSVNQRTHEIGVRLAMGATAGDVMRQVVTQGMRKLALGLVLGLAGALATTRLLGDLLDLFGASPTDPVTFASVCAVLTLAGLLGCAVPARRAIRVDPAMTLRHE